MYISSSFILSKFCYIISSRFINKQIINECSFLPIVGILKIYCRCGPSVNAYCYICYLCTDFGCVGCHISHLVHELEKIARRHGCQGAGCYY